MIENIKIFGERNSGTHFLSALLRNNITQDDIHFFKEGYIEGTGWKHGYPDIKLFNKDIVDKTLFIFIIRDKDAWIKSMFNNAYHYKQPREINEFLLRPLEVEESRNNHPVHDESEKLNIIDLRYSKIAAYLSFFKLVSNAIILNLEDLQANDKKLLVFLENYFKIVMKEEVNHIETHCKDSKIKSPNRTYNTVLPKNIKNNAMLEDFVNKIKKCYYCKRL